MSKRFRDTDPDGSTAAASGFKTVFVATSLDTHLALTLSFSDTVADFKKKILLNHEQCFPEIGALTIHSLKVKHQGKLYNLHESDMVVSSAFEGSERRWSLFVDASSSSLKIFKEQSILDHYDKGKFESPMVQQANDAIAWKSPGEGSRHTGLEVGHVDRISREDFSSMVRQDLVENDLRSKDDSKYQTDKVRYHTSYETRIGDGLNAKKRRKVKKSLDVAGKSALNTAPHTTTSYRFNDETAGVEDSLVGAGSKVSGDVQIGVIDAGASPYNTLFSGNKTSGRAAPESHVFEEEGVYGHHLDLSIRNQVSDMENVAQEKSVMDHRENMTRSNDPEQLHEEHPAVNTTTKKKKKKKQHKGTNSYIPDDHDATSKSETMLQGSVLQEGCGSQIIGIGNYGKEDDKSMLAPTASQKDYMEEDGRLTSNNEAWLSESVKPSAIVEATPAIKELVLCLGILNNSSEAVDSGESKGKIRKARKSTLHKQDQLDIEQDIEDELIRDEKVLAKIDPDKSEENSVPVRIYSGKHHKHLDSNETNLEEKEPASDVALTVMENLEGRKSGCSRKKKKKRSASHNDYCVVECTKDTNDTLVNKITSDILADQSIFSSIKGNEASKTFSPTNSQKNNNTASDNDSAHLPSTEVDRIYSKNDDLDLNSGKESNINQRQDRATLHDQVNMEQVKEAECLPMDQPDGELENKCTTKKKKKKKAKRTGNSTGEGLDIPEVNQQTMDDKEVASLRVNFGNVDTSKVSGSDEPNNVFASEGENGLVNFRRYFVPGEDHREAASADKVDRESNVVEGAEKADEHTFVPEGKHRPSDTWENHKNSSGIDSDDNKHEYSSSKARQRKNVSKKEISTSSKKRPIAPISSDVKVQTLKKSVEPILLNGSVSTVTVRPHLEENDGSLTSSTFNSISRDSKQALLNESSHKKQTGIHQELSRKKESDLEKSSQEKGLFTKKESDLEKSSQEKDLFTTPGVIFGDGNSESSGDENGILKSGSTTLSPSGSASSSGDSMREGSNNSARDHESRKPNPGSMSIDMVFRSSNQFKKAKLNASQSAAADSESQQEILPDGGPRRSGRISRAAPKYYG